MSEEIPFQVPPIPAELLFQSAIALYPCFLNQDIDEAAQKAIVTANDLWIRAHVHVLKPFWDQQER
jgi:hypothetical protein